MGNKKFNFHMLLTALGTVLVSVKDKEADERSRIMLNSTPFSCILIDKAYNCIDCNKEAEKLFGVSNKQEVTDKFFEFSPEYQPDGRKSKNKVYEFFKKAFEEGSSRFAWVHMIGNEQVPCDIRLVRVKYKGEYLIAAYTNDLRDIK